VWLRAVSRLGLVCRSTVYLLVGYLALRLALATHGRSAAPASSTGAVQAVTEPAWGRVLLVLLVAGLGAYALTGDLVKETREILEDHGHDPGVAPVRFTTHDALLAFVDSDLRPARTTVIERLSHPALTGLTPARAA
jgi:hypothetical protein